jgi:hypothetical protein
MRDHNPDDKGLLLRDVLEHSWKWFELHASQRMQLINYFLVAVAFLSAAYVAGLRDDAPEVSAVISMLGVILSACFQRIESRTRELIKLGETAVNEIEYIMENQFELPSVKLVQRAEELRSSFTSYGSVIRDLHQSTLIIFAIGFIYAYCKFFDSLAAL